VNCGVRFSPVISAPPAGYEIAATEWTYGDGYSSFEYDPWHFYQTPGTYTVCLKVTYVSDEKCCTREYCKDVKAEACEGGCKIEPKIDVQQNDAGCVFTFLGDIISTSTPVTNWFWDFGDGTTGNGSVITHKFPCKGTYKVCLMVFGLAREGEDCCFTRICTEVKVDCDPCEKQRPAGSSAGIPVTNESHANVTLSDRNVIVLNQNVPNPFAESTVISYSIPGRYSKAQILFTTAAGSLVKTAEVTGSRGSLTVYADDLSSGVYTYTLVVDGKPIDSKKMIRR